MGTGVTVNKPSIGIVNTGAKDIPDLTSALNALESKASGQVWVDQSKLPGTVVGQFKLFMGVDTSDAVLLVKSSSGELSLWEQNFGPHPGGNGPGLFNSLYRQIAALGDAVTAPSTFDQKATAYAYFGAPGNVRNNLKRTGYNIALAGGQIYVEKPNTNGPHTVLAALPVPSQPQAQPPLQAAATQVRSAFASMGTKAGLDASIAALIRKNFTIGTFQTFSGKVVHELAMAGSTRPAGAYLQLAYPIKVSGQGVAGETETRVVKELYLGGIEQFPNGRAKVNGQIGLLPIRPFIGPGNPNPAVSDYLPWLSGTTDVGRGEPSFNGLNVGFKDAKGNALPAVMWSDNVPDIPSHLVVPDFDQNKAFIGSYGGFVAYGPFRGFQETVAIRQPDALDQQVKMQPDGTCTSADGRQLRLVSTLSGGDHPDPSATKFFVDPQSSEMYIFRQAGLVGNLYTLSGVIDMAQRAPIVALENGSARPAA